MGKRFDDYFLKIGEVAKQFNIEPHILRYWEKEFKSLKPKKSNSGQRIYNRADVELVEKIKELLYEKKFSIEGAKKLVDSKAVKSANGNQKDNHDIDRDQVQDLTKALAPVKQELENILLILKRKY